MDKTSISKASVLSGMMPCVEGVGKEDVMSHRGFRLHTTTRSDLVLSRHMHNSPKQGSHRPRTRSPVWP